jgi:hypothetical protein
MKRRNKWTTLACVRDSMAGLERDGDARERQRLEKN